MSDKKEDLKVIAAIDLGSGTVKLSVFELKEDGPHQLELHEIDTQAIVAKHGVCIAPLRQLLFFHPKYIAEIMANDPLAINDIPLKLVLHQLDETTTQLSFKNPVDSLQDYGLKPEMAAELLKRVQGILSF